MAKVKGEKKLNKAISKELEPFGISKATCTDEYSYNYENENITFKLTEGTNEDIWFIDFVEERFNYQVRFPFVMSLLHEVGHHKANDDIDGEVYEFCLQEKKRIEEEMENADGKYSKVLEYQYFNLPDEIMATQWAVKWAKKHPKKVRDMWYRMKKALLDFYAENGIFDDIDFDEIEE